MTEKQNDEAPGQEPSPSSAIDKHKERIKEVIGTLKEGVEKTLGQLSKKKSTPLKPTDSKVSVDSDNSQADTFAPTPAIKPKPPVDYTKLAKDKFRQAQKIAKEMMALALNKEIEIDFSEAENYELISHEKFQKNIDTMTEHLNAYLAAKAENEKTTLASTRAVCRQDQPLLFEMVKDIEMELMLIYKAIEQSEELEMLQEKFDKVTVQKWRPLVNLKESDTDSTFCSSDNFNAKFADLLSLNAVVNQSIHARHS